MFKDIALDHDKFFGEALTYERPSANFSLVIILPLF